MPSVKSRMAGIVGLLCLLFSFGFAAWSADECRRSQQCGGYQRAQEKSPNSKPEESFWHKTTDDPVAYFTLWLAVFTGGLAIASIWQGVFLIRADRTARIAADAAREASVIATAQAAHTEKYAVEAARRASANEEANRIARSHTSAAQRAFVSVKGQRAIRIFGATEWQLRVVWENSGPTPTRNMRSRIQCDIFDAKLPNDFNFDHASPEFRPGFIGPRATIESASIPYPHLTDAQLIQIRNEERFLYLWGEARYYDIFPETAEHVTRFCYNIEIYGAVEDVGIYRFGEPLREGIVDARFVLHSTGNCADDECRAQGFQ